MLKLENLKLLYLKKCENIAFDKSIGLNLKILHLEKCYIIRPKELFIFPKVEKCILLKHYLYTSDFCDFLISFPSLIKLKDLTCQIKDVISINNSPLERLVIKSDNNNIFKKAMLDKLILFKNLKEVDFELYNIKNNEIANIPGANTSVENIKLFYFNKNNKYKLFNLQKKFPNLTKLEISTSFDKYCKEPYIQIKENENCKIKKFLLSGDGKIKLYTTTFDKLIEAQFYFNRSILSYKECFPIFQNNCLLKLTHLKVFKLNCIDNIPIEILKNIYINLDYM